MPVAVGHGTLDPVIPVEFGRAARAWLTEHGFVLRYRESVMGHSIDPRFAREVGQWLHELLPGVR
jgi:phospholipase/carboxylesterase